MYFRPDDVVTALWASADSDKAKTPVVAASAASAARRENSRMVLPRVCGRGGKVAENGGGGYGAPNQTARSDCLVISPRPASKPATEISSSSSSQCRPIRLIATRWRASALACRRRGYHAKGTPNVRPSERSTHIVCSSKRTAVAEMVIPGLQDEASPLRDNTQDMRKFDGIEAITLREGNIGLK